MVRPCSVDFTLKRNERPIEVVAQVDLSMATTALPSAALLELMYSGNNGHYYIDNGKHKLFEFINKY